jgi:copper chaperone for superoxide dismutase
MFVLPGVKRVEANLKDQLVLIEGTAPPSSIVTAIQATGRDAILRGSGTSNSVLYLPFSRQTCEGGTDLVV